MEATKRTVRYTPLLNGEDIYIWEFKKNNYDIDIVSVYKEIKKLFETANDVKAGYSREEYLQLIEYNIQNYCELNDYNFKFHFDFGNLVIPYSVNWYPHAMKLQIISMDSDLIRLFLNYHKNKYPAGKESFVKFVETRVYINLKANSRFKSVEQKMPIILKWLEDNVKAVSIKKIKSQPVTFDGLFRDPEYATQVVEMLKNADVLNPLGTWVGFSTMNTEMLALIDVLKSKNYIKKFPHILTAKLFRDKFNLIISDRSLRTNTQVRTDMYKNYSEIIPDIKP